VTSSDSPRVLIVGGSLVGLASAIALARRGAAVTVLERAGEVARTLGGGLGVDVELLQQVTGLEDEPPVCWGIDRATSAWALLTEWLTEQAGAHEHIDIRRRTEVTQVGERWALTATGERFEADLIIGADGARSTVRRWVAPAHPDPAYAGYLLWRTMVDEARLPEAILPPPCEPSRELYSGAYRLVTYLVPGADRSTRRGRRRLNIVWYDPARAALLAQTGLLEGSRVLGTLDSASVPAPLREELRAIAQARWPSPWREALQLALRDSAVFATPVVEYMPETLVRGSALLAGDAAHAATPMVGGGFRQGLHDVLALVDAWDQDMLVEVGARYETARLLPARTHVRRSMAASAEYLARAAHAS
jgi:2-polyprenyl-6-methoxyphenol hydroxylase-like FAD-dependent oxidoreductase